MKILVLAFSTLLLCSGCVSSQLERQTAERLRKHLGERTYFFTQAGELDKLRYAHGMLTWSAAGPRSSSIASATLITEDGYFLTAKHAVLKNEAGEPLKPWVIDFNGGQPQVIAAEFVWASKEGDVALIKAAVKTPKFFEWSHPREKLERGTPLVQGGLRSRMSCGEVRIPAHLDRPGSECVMVHHSVKVRAGESGGPIVDRDGKLVAINTDRLYLALDLHGFRSGGGQSIRPNINALERLIAQHRGMRADRASSLVLKQE